MRYEEVEIRGSVSLTINLSRHGGIIKRAKKYKGLKNEGTKKGRSRTRCGKNLKEESQKKHVVQLNRQKRKERDVYIYIWMRDRKRNETTRGSWKSVLQSPTTER